MQELNLDYENLQVVINGIMVALALFKWISPILVGCLGFYTYRKVVERIDKRKEQREKSKEIQKQQNKTTKVISNTYNVKNVKTSINFNNKEIETRLDNYEEPIDKSKYRSLSLEFGKDGKIKQ